ncbi:MAG TPA: hypothetical protein VHG09_02880 [Longimicrobiales bacterium]|nr:hypothetical protein [Longimicrobiales bacterium]
MAARVPPWGAEVTDLERWRERIRGWGERMSIEVEVGELRELLDVVDMLEHRIERLEQQRDEDRGWAQHLHELHHEEIAFWRTRARVWKAHAKETRRHWRRMALLAFQEARASRKRRDAWKALAKLNRGRYLNGRRDPRDWPVNLFRDWENEP